MSSDARTQTGLEKGILLAVVILPLIATAYAVYRLWNSLVTWQDLAILGIMYVASAAGIGIGFHRMLTHRGFEAPAPVRFFFLALGSMALEGPAIEWAATHYKHHAKADQEGDPHSPLEGFWHAHFGWLFRGRFVNSGVWAKPFQNDPVVRFIDRTFWFWAILSFVIPAALGYMWGGWHGWWTGVLWGGVVRVGLVHHVTWSVNSVCHVFGQRPFKTGDRSTNHWLVGLLAGGEGWHNNHHAFQRSAFHGLYWWQFDLSGLIIRWLELAHVIRDVQRVDPERLARRQPLVDQLAPAAGPIGGAARHPAG